MNNKDIKKIEKFIGVSKEIKETPEYVFIENIEIEKEQYLEIIHIIEDLIEENRMLNNKQTKIIADSFHEKMAEKFDEDFMPKTKYEKLKEKLKQAYNYVKEEMYIDENPTICEDENCTITRLPTSLCLCNEDLDKLLDLLKDEE